MRIDTEHMTVVGRANGKFVGECTPCGFVSKEMPNEARVRNSLQQHACGNEHRRTMRRLQREEGQSDRRASRL